MWFGHERGRTSQYQQEEGYGENIIIQHANGYPTRYAKLSEIFVEEGQTVINPTCDLYYS